MFRQQRDQQPSDAAVAGPGVADPVL